MTCLRRRRASCLCCFSKMQRWGKKNCRRPLTAHEATRCLASGLGTQLRTEAPCQPADDELASTDHFSGLGSSSRNNSRRPDVRCGPFSETAKLTRSPRPRARGTARRSSARAHGPKIDQKFEFVRLLDRNIAGPGAAQNLVDQIASTAELAQKIRPIGDQAERRSSLCRSRPLDHCNLTSNTKQLGISGSSRCNSSAADARFDEDAGIMHRRQPGVERQTVQSGRD